MSLPNEVFIGEKNSDYTNSCWNLDHLFIGSFNSGIYVFIQKQYVYKSPPTSKSHGYMNGIDQKSLPPCMKNNLTIMNTIWGFIF